MLSHIRWRKKASSDRPQSESGRITSEKLKPYSNAHDESYQTKLDQVAADIRSGSLDTLSHSIAKSRYRAGQTVTRRLQIDLCKLGLLARYGRQYRVAA